MPASVFVPVLTWLGAGASTCPPMMPGLVCNGGTYLAHGNVTNPEACCELCTADTQCGAFTHVGVDNTCELKYTCAQLKNDYNNSNTTAGEPEVLPPAPPPTCILPKQGRGFMCDTKSIAQHNASTVGDCCDLCTANANCQTFSYQANTSNCKLHHSCSQKPRVEGWTTGWRPALRSSKFQKYRVGRGSFDVTGYHCSSNETVTAMWYPKGDGPFNVIVYGHGEWGEIDEMDDWLQMIASMGLIVIAPFAGEQETYCGSPFVYDYIRAAKVAKKKGARLHPALETADWSRIGVVGQSMGAKFALPSAINKHADDNITCVLMSGDVPSHQYDTDLPMMFTTGSLDKSNHNGTITDYFHNLTSPNKVLANLVGGFHMEPQEGERLNLYSSLFLSCHVSQVEEACEVIYGNASDSMCNTQSYAECSACTSDSPCTVTTSTTTHHHGPPAVALV